MRSFTLFALLCVCLSLGAEPLPTPDAPPDRLESLKKKLADLDSQIAAAKSADVKVDGLGAKVTALQEFVLAKPEPPKPAVIVPDAPPVTAAPPVTVVTYTEAVDASAGKRPRTPIRRILGRLFPRLGSRRGWAAGGSASMSAGASSGS